MNELTVGGDVISEQRAKVFHSCVDRSSGPDACWPWKRALNENGYGRFKTPNHYPIAHRVAWALANGPIPDGLNVCHNCPGGDNPACQNPAHLWLGTDVENVADRHAKGRDARGDRHGTATRPDRISRGNKHYARTNPELLARGKRHGLTAHPERAARGETHGTRTHPEKVARGIRSGMAKLNDEKVAYIRSSGLRRSALATMFGVSNWCIQCVLDRTTWRHVSP